MINRNPMVAASKAKNFGPQNSAAISLPKRSSGRQFSLLDELRTNARPHDNRLIRLDSSVAETTNLTPAMLQSANFPCRKGMRRRCRRIASVGDRRARRQAGADHGAALGTKARCRPHAALIGAACGGLRGVGAGSETAVKYPAYSSLLARSDRSLVSLLLSLRKIGHRIVRACLYALIGDGPAPAGFFFPDLRDERRCRRNTGRSSSLAHLRYSSRLLPSFR
jgi:hypothetical protein